MQIEFFENVHFRLIMGGDDQVHTICILYSNKIKYPIIETQNLTLWHGGSLNQLFLLLCDVMSLSTEAIYKFQLFCNIFFVRTIVALVT